MLPCFTARFGNAASLHHSFGWEAEALVTVAREQVAALVNAEPTEVVFTSGATESNNLAIRGVAEAMRPKGNHLITVATEHSAVLDPIRRLEREGFRVTILGVNESGEVDLAALAEAMTEETTLVTVMAANNEIGTLHPIAEIGKIARERDVVFHTDAAQAVGKVSIDFRAAQIGLLSLSAHKMCGPKGVGTLVVRRRDPRVRLSPLFEGGGHEHGLRSGTLNVPGIVGLGKACEIAQAEMMHEATRLTALRNRLLERLRASIDDLEVNGGLEYRLPGNLNVSFPDVEGDALITAVADVAVSTGSACTEAEQRPSHVLLALGHAETRVKSSIRFGIGRFNTVEEIDWVAERFAAECQRLRALAPGRETEISR
jgi:cysteine desulfurase